MLVGLGGLKNERGGYAGFFEELGGGVPGGLGWGFEAALRGLVGF